MALTSGCIAVEGPPGKDYGNDWPTAGVSRQQTTELLIYRLDQYQYEYTEYLVRWLLLLAASPNCLFHF